MPARYSVRWMVPLALLVAVGACQVGLPEVSEEEGTRVAELANPAAGELLRTLVEQLTSALREKGPAYAVEFCSTEALPLTAAVQAGLQGGMELKRTSFRFRNPANAPDEAEEKALSFFEDAILAGEDVPASYVHRTSGEEFRFYRPLFLGETCLQCHGDPETFDPGVRTALAERYPGDLATGYEAGELRGVVRVSVPADLLER